MICKAIIKINFVYTASQDTHNLTALTRVEKAINFEQSLL